jgi:hypothetical protein
VRTGAPALSTASGSSGRPSPGWCSLGLPSGPCWLGFMIAVRTGAGASSDASRAERETSEIGSGGRPDDDLLSTGKPPSSWRFTTRSGLGRAGRLGSWSVASAPHGKDPHAAQLAAPAVKTP